MDKAIKLDYFSLSTARRAPFDRFNHTVHVASPSVSSSMDCSNHSTMKTQHTFLLIPIVLTVITPVMSIYVVSENDPHQSPIWIKAEHILCLSAPGTLVPLTIIGAKPCPKSVHRICGSAVAVQTRKSSRFGRNVKYNGRLRFQSDSLVQPLPYLAPSVVQS